MPDIFSRPSFAQSSKVAPAGMQQFGVSPPSLTAGAEQAGQIIPLPITPTVTGGSGGGIIGGGGIDIDTRYDEGGDVILGPQQQGGGQGVSMPSMPPFPFTQKELLGIMNFRRKGGY